MCSATRIGRRFPSSMALVAVCLVGTWSSLSPAAVVVTQGSGLNYVAFESESYSAITTTGDDSWMVVDTTPTLISPQNVNVLPSTTDASGGEALLADFGISQHESTATWRIRFDETGTYRFYVRYSMFDSALSPGAYGNEDSFFRPTDFNVVPTAGDVNSVSGFDTTYVEGEFGWKNTGVDYVVTTDETGAAYVEFSIENRENGLSIDRIVFSKTNNLSSTALDALVNGTSIDATHFTDAGSDSD